MGPRMDAKKETANKNSRKGHGRDCHLSPITVTFLECQATENWTTMGTHLFPRKLLKAQEILIETLRAEHYSHFDFMISSQYFSSMRFYTVIRIKCMTRIIPHKFH